MTTEITPPAESAAPSATPTVAISRAGLKRLYAVLLPGTVMMYAVYQGIQQILLPAQVEAIDPAAKIQNLALLTTVSSVAAVLGLPAGGAISDKTRGRWGRRTPWLVLAGIASALLTAVMGTAANIIALAIVYSLLWFGMNYYQAVIYAIVPDRIPENRRGTASAIMGIAIPLGVLVGVNLVAHMSQEIGYLTIAGLFLLSVALLVTVGKEPPFHGHVRIADDGTAVPTATVPIGDAHSRNPIYAVGRFFASFRHWDFSIAFVSRLLLFLGYFVASGYMFYIVQDEIGAKNVPGGSIAIGVSILSSINTIAWIVIVPAIGWLADKVDRRKLIVGLCGVLMGVSFLIPVFFPTFVGLVVYSICAGAFFGAYMALDIAIMSLVLPDRENEGRDMAVLAIATSGPQVVSTLIAGGLIIAFGGYNAVFIFGAIVALLGGLVMLLIKRIR